MTDPDLTPEAVERVADALECAARVSTASKMLCGWMDDAAATLRALSAELEGSRKQNRLTNKKLGLQVLYTDKQQARAEAAEAKAQRAEEITAAVEGYWIARTEASDAKLKEALSVLKDMRDDKTGFRHAVHFRRRAAVYLASLEGDKG